MKNIRFIINPSSGRKNSKRLIDDVCMNLLDSGFLVSRYYTQKAGDAMNDVANACSIGVDYIIACGGDGTVNEVVNGLYKCNTKIPLGIIPAGTMNDFAHITDMPSTVNEIVEMIKGGKTKYVDIGKTGDRYFANVAAGGFLTAVAHNVSASSKTLFGRNAYYIEGVREFFADASKTKRIKFTSKEFNGEEDVMLFLVSNSTSIGGFRKIAPFAEIEDGLLDCLIITKSSFQETLTILFSMNSGKHINHPNVIYFKTKDILIESKEHLVVDVDGDIGGLLPMKFEIIENGLMILTK